MMGLGRKKILVLVLLVAGATLLASLWQWIDTIPLGIAVAVILVPLQHRLSSRIPEGISAALITLIILSLGIAGVLFTVTVMQENLTTNQEILGKAASGIEILAPQFAGFGIPREAIGETTARIQGIVGAVENFWSGLTLSAPSSSPSGQATGSSGASCSEPRRSGWGPTIAWRRSRWIPSMPSSLSTSSSSH
ncbi:MAG: hypothetical protein LUP92_04195 [Methanomicrobiales archaeon]|nr:hypothetical protein [Methanomicrobiales archaeon]